MSETVINNNTKIELTLGKLIAILGTLLTIVFGFYLLVVQPQIDSQKEEMKDLSKSTTESFENINKQLIDISNGIGVINGNIEGINNRFRDLNSARTNNHDGSGSFNN